MMHRCLVAALALATFAPSSDAGPRRRAQPSYQSSYQPYYSPSYQPTYSPSYQPIYQPAYQPSDSLPSVVTLVAGSATEFTPAAPSGVYSTNYTPVATPTYQPAGSDESAWAGAGDGLDEVNAKRAARGLRPFIRDEGLTQAARSC